MPRDLAPILPSSVEVHFTPYPCGDGVSWADIPTDYSETRELADLGLPTATGSGVTLALRDACHAICHDDGDPSNQTTLQTLARQVARDRLGWLLVAFDRAYTGIVAPTPDATVGAVVWRYRAEDATTRLATEPTGGEPTRLGHDDVTHDCDARPLLYGGTTHATVSNGVLTLPRAHLAIVDGALRWFKADPDPVTICPTTTQPAGMTTDDGTAAAT